MRDETQRTVDAIRRRSSEVENHLIDEYRTGYIDRREFVRRGAVIHGAVSREMDLGRARAPADPRPRLVDRHREQTLDSFDVPVHLETTAEEIGGATR